MPAATSPFTGGDSPAVIPAFVLHRRCSQGGLSLPGVYTHKPGSHRNNLPVDSCTPAGVGANFPPSFKGGLRGVVTTGGRLAPSLRGRHYGRGNLAVVGDGSPVRSVGQPHAYQASACVQHFCRAWMPKCRGRTGGAIVPGPHPVSRPPGQGVAVGLHCRRGPAFPTGTSSLRSIAY